MSDVNDFLTYPIPVQLQAIEKVSTADSVIQNRKQVQIIPREQSTFGRDANGDAFPNDTLSERLRFYISDTSHYLDMSNSYINCDFQVECKTSGDVVLDRFLDEGGIHSCISRVTVSVGGAELEHIDDYGKWYNSCVNFPTNSEEYRNNMLASSGDSTNSLYDDVRDPNVDIQEVTITPAEAVYDHTGGASEKLLTLSAGSDAGDAENELNEGDLLRIKRSTGGVVSYITAQVLTVEDKNNITINSVLSADIATGDIVEIEKVKDLLPSTRKEVANGGVHKLSFMLPLGSLQLFEYFPLPLIQNLGPLEILVEFNDAVLSVVLANNGDVSGSNKIGYKISNPRFIANMVKPSNDIMQMHKALYDAQGLVYTYDAWRHFENNVPSGSGGGVFNIQTNLMSVKSIVSILSDRDRANTTNVTAQAYPSQSSFLRDNLIKYRFYNGAQRFPEYDFVNMTGDVFGSQAREQLSLSLNQYGSKIATGSIKPYEWRGLSSSKFIISTPTTDYPSFFSGLQTKNNFIESELLFSTGTAVGMAYHTWLMYDSMIVLNRDNGLRVLR